MTTLMLLRSEECTSDRVDIGGKTVRLRELQMLGLRVPAFVAVPCDVVARAYADGAWDDAALLEVAREIHNALTCDRYAVRSSALVEDAAQQSFAGQFRTQLAVSADGLADAIRDVVSQAADFLHGDVSGFSLLIQKYIAADRAGVLFTRNPLGTREMIVEYSTGAGEAVVGGTVTPQRLSVLWTETAADCAAHSTDLPQLESFVESCKKIDGYYGWPQDIEWCVASSVWYFLQARPITTLHAADVEAAQYLDATLPHTDPFFYEKTEIAEIAPRPCTFTLDLLQRVYAAGGPVARAYARYGVRFAPCDFLRVLGNELYVDREKELHTLLPAYTHLGARFGTPHAARFSGALTTLRNIWKLNTISFARSSAITEALHCRLRAWDSTVGHKSFSVLLDEFFIDYELIFEINLLAENAFTQLTRAVRPLHITVADALAMPLSAEYAQAHTDIDHAGLVGNSFDVADESRFVSRVAAAESSAQNRAPLDALPKIKKEYLQRVVARAQQWSALREYGRLLTVKHISRLRSYVLSLAAKQHVSSPRLIYFATLDELLRGTISEADCLARQQKSQQYQSFHLPHVLSSVVLDKSSQPLGVSAGIAHGELARADDLRARTSQHQNGCILYTDVLSPDLASLLPEVNGIISHHGGVLSHLAIIAREHHIPVIVNVSLAASDISIGDIIEINGTNGTIKKEQKRESPRTQR